MLRSRTIAERLARMVRDGVAPAKVADEAASYLKERDLEYLLPNVIEYLEGLGVRDGQENACVVETAREVSNELAGNIAKSAGADKSDVVKKIDPELLGGYVIRHKNRIVDASLKNQLNQLHKHLLTNISSYE